MRNTNGLRSFQKRVSLWDTKKRDQTEKTCCQAAKRNRWGKTGKGGRHVVPAIFLKIQVRIAAGVNENSPVHHLFFLLFKNCYRFP